MDVDFVRDDIKYEAGGRRYLAQISEEQWRVLRPLPAQESLIKSVARGSDP
jgi:hypothetical protein